jgi:hypothetical protein
MWSFQKPDGRFEIMNRYHKENGIVLWASLRHARLTQDRGWLRRKWPRIEKVLSYIKRLRGETYEAAPDWDDGLIPPGFPDGGIGGDNQYEYTNVYWCLVGVKAAAEGARWLGMDRRAREIEAEYDDFYRTFRSAAARDMRTDSSGNRYLPVLMRPGSELPQRGQWAFCHAVYPGQLFAKDDTLVRGNLEMLKATEREGMVRGTGWDPGGIWTYFGSFYAHAWLWQGDGRKAAEALYAMANHASPLLAWREEQSLKDGAYRKVGDMPHNWASAEFVRLVSHLIALDRGTELHLFEGLPSEWAHPGMVTALKGAGTVFGALDLMLTVAPGGKLARLKADISRGKRTLPSAVVIHLAGITGEQAVIRLPAKFPLEKEIRIGRSE